MSSEWHFVRDGQRQGPVSPTQLHQLALSGQLQGSDLVWKEGMAEWSSASGIDFLAKALAGRVPPIPRRPQSVAVAEPGNENPPQASDPLAALASFGKRAKAAGRVAAERAKQANAAIPNQIKVGTTSIPKWIVIGGAALLVVVVGCLLFGGTPNLTATKLQAAYEGIKSDKSGPYDEKMVKVTGKVMGRNMVGGVVVEGCELTAGPEQK
jgi:hypothetical protein